MASIAFLSHYQMTVDSQSATESLTDSEKQLCHRVLYGFFHGKIDNPVAAGKQTVSVGLVHTGG